MSERTGSIGRMNEPAPARGRRAVLPILLAAYALLCIVSLRAGQVGGDFALYILHARNLARGIPYAATGFVYNPLNAIMSPASYPPGFPLLIVPVYAIAGLDLLAFKLVVVATLVALLPILYALFRPVTGRGLAAVITGACGLMPDLFNRRDTIQSEIPFTLWCFAALLCYDRLRQSRHHGFALLVGLATSVAMACATRTAGVALAAALCLICVGRRQGPWRAALVATVIGAAIAALGDRLLHVDSGTYLSYFAAIRQEGVAGFALGAAKAYGQGLVGVWALNFGPAANAPVLAILALLLAFGWVLRLREDASAPEAFLLLYVGMLIAFPVRSEPVRYLAPVAPLLVYYPSLATQRVFERAGQARLAPPAIALAWVALFLPYYAANTALAYERPQLLADPESQALFAAVRRLAGADELILSGQPRVLTLMTERPASIWPADPTPASVRDYASRSGAGWLVEESTADRAAHAFVSGPGAATLVWHNRRYGLWRIPTLTRRATGSTRSTAMPGWQLLELWASSVGGGRSPPRSIVKNCQDQVRLSPPDNS